MQQEFYQTFILRESQLEDNLLKAYSLVWGQYTSALQSVVKGLEDYNDNSDDYNVIWLLKN